MALRSLLLPFASVSLLLATVNPALLEVKTVYFLSMGNGLDQYLANQITKTGRYQVTTDAKRADVIITDRLGTAFEDKWKELFPPPAPAPTASAPAAGGVAPRPSADKIEEKRSGRFGVPDATDSSANRPTWSGRSRGTIFFVSRKDGSVIWSHYMVPEDGRSKSMDELARKIVAQLEKELKPPKS